MCICMMDIVKLIFIEVGLIYFFLVRYRIVGVIFGVEVFFGLIVILVVKEVLVFYFNNIV